MCMLCIKEVQLNYYISCKQLAERDVPCLLLHLRIHCFLSEQSKVIHLGMFMHINLRQKDPNCLLIGLDLFAVKNFDLDIHFIMVLEGPVFFKKSVRGHKICASALYPC